MVKIGIENQELISVLRSNPEIKNNQLVFLIDLNEYKLERLERDLIFFTEDLENCKKELLIFFEINNLNCVTLDVNAILYNFKLVNGQIVFIKV